MMLKHSSYTATNLRKASVWKTVNLNWMLFNHQCQHVDSVTYYYWLLRIIA